MQPMNNRQNGRRRGRNNNQRPQGGGGQSRGGGDSGNRIDSRARGNAAQLLEKYKNMAREAQMSGDRVQTEYYLQFADHYFRVLADSRSRQEEQRPPRQDDRYDDQGGVDEGAPFGFGDEGDPSDEPRESGRDQPRDRGQSRDRDPSRGRRDRPDRPDRPERSERHERRERAEPQVDARSQVEHGGASGGDAPDQDERPARRPAGRLQRRRPFGERDDDGDMASIDVAVLPPAIGAVAAAPATEAAASGEDAPPPRRRAVRTRKPAADDSIPAEG